MALTLLHTADWHIGKPFGGFEPDKAGVLGHARLTAIDRLADAARGHGAGMCWSRAIFTTGKDWRSGRCASRSPASRPIAT